jgi:hypothetical protein
MDNYFAHLSQINVSDHLERKGEFAYLSWPFAVSQLRLADPTATWEVRRFNGLPFLKSEVGYFVEVAVTVQGITLSQIHPVLDSKNRPIAEPSSFDINTAIARCLVKAIALHGLGLYVYAGEDLPDGHGTPEQRASSSVSELRPQGRASAAQLRYLRRLIQETGSDLQKVVDYFGVRSLEDLTPRAASRAIRSLEKTRRAA